MPAEGAQARYEPPLPLEDLTFRPSPAPSIGVELELQVLDAATGELAPGAQRILDACAEEDVQGVAAEMLLSMLEVKTDVCRDVAEVRDGLLPLLARVRNIARSLGYELAVAGTHPRAQPFAAAVFPDERYDRIRRKQGWLAYQENVFGLHIHVGVPGADEALGLVRLLVPYLPHMLALSANSPFWEGIDTGYASAPAIMFRPAAHAGVPPHFAGWDEFVLHCRFLHQGGAIASTKDLYWDVRPRPGYGTLEFRVCDAPPSPAVLLGLAALARCLVIDGLRLLREYPRLLRGDAGNHWLAAENKWLAARYGLRAECVRRPGRQRASLAEDTDALLRRLLPAAREAGEETFLAALGPGGCETGAERQRRVFRATGDWRCVIRDTLARWDGELSALLPTAGPRIAGPPTGDGRAQAAEVTALTLGPGPLATANANPRACNAAGFAPR